MRSRPAALLAVALLAGCGLSSGGDEPLAREPSATSTTTAAPPATDPTLAPTTSAAVDPLPPTTAPAGAVPWPDLAAARVGAVVTPTGVVLPVTGGDGTSFSVVTPCARSATVTGTPLAGAHFVLDPGHGGEERGAVGPGGLAEADVNLAVAMEAKRLLEASGATVVLTRTADYRIALRVRAQIATNLEPLAFVSIHHNAEPDGPWPGPGSETYYQITDGASRRLAGLLWEEEVAALAPFGTDWVADTDAGAKYRLASDGGDYYGILRRSAGVPAVLSEAAFVSNPAEEQLLATAEFQRAEAEAITRALIRFVTTDDPGSGFTEPYPRTTPAGPGGGIDDCEDPPLE